MWLALNSQSKLLIDYLILPHYAPNEDSVHHFFRKISSVFCIKGAISNHPGFTPYDNSQLNAYFKIFIESTYY